jgi:glycosyltransferase involved in cell wall biosynthesis
VSDANSKPDSQKTRQELLDEIYLLRDIAGEREQRAQDLRARVNEQATALAEVRGALARVLASRSWRVTAPLRAVIRWFGGRCNSPDPFLQMPIAAPTSSGETASRVRMLKSGGRATAKASPHSRNGSVSPRDGKPRLFVDITELALCHGKTGVQRVTREILRALLGSPPEGYSVVPVVASGKQPYCEVVEFGASELQGAAPLDLGPRMNGQAGDVFLGLDHSMRAVVENADQLVAMRERGVRVWFVCNDTLPLAHPEWFPSDVHEKFERWFRAIASVGTGIACISHATELDVRHWVKTLEIQRTQPLAYGVFQLGSDMPIDPHEAALSPAEQAVVDQIRRLPSSFLMVGTVEPRKGHAQALEAFNQLWSDSEDAALVIAGQPGWMTEVTQRRIRHHEELDKRLFWFMDASDALLDKLYDSCTTLLVASEGEGYGLPLVEALRHNLPVLCRDLPVFREIAGEAVTYYSGDTPDVLASAVKFLITVSRQNEVPRAATTQSPIWMESTLQLMKVVLGSP